MLICLFTVLEQLPHWKCLFSISSKESSYKINKCLLLLPTIWLLVCLEVGKLKPREINIFNKSSNHWKWWNLWCPKRCQFPWVWEYMGASTRWCDSSETPAQILPCILVELHFLGPPQYPQGCVYTLCSAQRYSHMETCPAGPHLCIWAYAREQAGAGVVQLVFLLLGEQAPQACLTRSISSPRSVPRVLAGPTLPAASAQAGCERMELCLCWWFCVLSVYLSKSMTLKIPLCSSQILNWLVTLSPSLLVLMESKITLRPWM